MKRSHRKALYFIFLFAFLISAPLVVLYTAGYRYNFGIGKIVQTGVLSLSTIPKGASVFIDSEELKDSTPSIINDVFPSEHVIRLQKEGYTTWEKILKIESRQTTFVNNAVLFLDQQAEITTEITEVSSGLSQDRTKSAFVISENSWAEIWIHNSQTLEQKLIARIPSESSNSYDILWSKDDSFVAIQITSETNTTYSAINISSGNITTLSDVMSNITNVFWDTDNGYRLFISSAFGLYKIDLPSEQIENTNTEAQSARSYNGHYLTVKTLSDRTVVSEEQDNELSSVLAYLPLGDYFFSPAPEGIIMLEDVNRERIILLSPNGGDQPILLNVEAKDWQWEPDRGKRILYSNGFDLHIYDTENATDETITRLGSNITGMMWYPSLSAIIYSQDQGIYAIEIDRRDGHYVTKLSEGENINDLWMDDKGKRLFFFGTIHDVSGIFEKNLQK